MPPDVQARVRADLQPNAVADLMAEHE